MSSHRTAWGRIRGERGWEDRRARANRCRSRLQEGLLASIGYAIPARADLAQSPYSLAVEIARDERKGFCGRCGRVPRVTFGARGGCWTDAWRRFRVARSGLSWPTRFRRAGSPGRRDPSSANRAREGRERTSARARAAEPRTPRRELKKAGFVIPKSTRFRTARIVAHCLVSVNSIAVTLRAPNPLLALLAHVRAPAHAPVRSPFLPAPLRRPLRRHSRQRRLRRLRRRGPRARRPL